MGAQGSKIPFQYDEKNSMKSDFWKSCCFCFICYIYFIYCSTAVWIDGSNVQMFIAWFYGFLLGICTLGAGGVFLWARSLGKARASIPSACVWSGAFSHYGSNLFSGFMMGILMFWLLPESMDIGGMVHALGGVLAGLLLPCFLDRIFRSSTFVWCFLTDCIFAGMALGILLVNHRLLAEVWFAGAALYHIPKGICYLKAAQKPADVLMIVCCYGILTGSFSSLGNILGNLSPSFNAFFLSAAAGGILFSLIRELWQEEPARSRWSFADAWHLLGLVLGILIK